MYELVVFAYKAKSCFHSPPSLKHRCGIAKDMLCLRVKKCLIVIVIVGYPRFQPVKHRFDGAVVVFTGVAVGE